MLLMANSKNVISFLNFNFSRLDHLIWLLIQNINLVSGRRNERPVGFYSEFDIAYGGRYYSRMAKHIMRLATVMNLMLAKVGKINMLWHLPKIWLIKQCPKPYSLIHTINV